MLEWRRLRRRDKKRVMCLYAGSEYIGCVLYEATRGRAKGIPFNPDGPSRVIYVGSYRKVIDRMEERAREQLEVVVRRLAARCSLGVGASGYQADAGDDIPTPEDDSDGEA